jgi:N-methylhydantoinase A
VHGYPIKAPMLDIHTVGAGGGSIALSTAAACSRSGRAARRRSGAGLLRPGNTEPAVTDANVVLQTLNPVEILGGRMKVHRELAVRSIERLASELGMASWRRRRASSRWSPPTWQRPSG